MNDLIPDRVSHKAPVTISKEPEEYFWCSTSIAIYACISNSNRITSVQNGIANLLSAVSGGSISTFGSGDGKGDSSSSSATVSVTFSYKNNIKNTRLLNIVWLCVAEYI